MTNIIDDFLADGGYASLDEWMADSDFEKHDDGEWYYRADDDNFSNYSFFPHPVDPEGTIMGAIEASGFSA